MSDVPALFVRGPTVLTRVGDACVVQGEAAWNEHVWTFTQYMSLYMRNHSEVPVTVGAQVDNLDKVADWVDVLTFQTSHRLQQPERPTPHVSQCPLCMPFYDVVWTQRACVD